MTYFSNAERCASAAAGSRSEARGRVGRERGRLGRLFSRPPSEPCVTVSVLHGSPVGTLHRFRTTGITPPSPAVVLHLWPFALWLAFPASDSYGHSGTRGRASRRPSRRALLPYVKAWLRWPVRAVMRVHDPLSCPRRCGGPRSRHPQGHASSSGALAMGLVGTTWALGFRPCSFHLAMQVLRVCAVCAFSAPPAFPPCSCPFCLSVPVRRLTSRISSKSSPDSSGIRFELLRRTARHERTLAAVACMPLFGPADDRAP